MKKINSKTIIILISFLLVVAITYTGFYYKNYYFIKIGKKYQIIEECEKKIKDSKYPNFDEKKAYVGAINGYLKSGVDKYTHYEPKFDINPVESMEDYVNSSGTAIASGFQIKCNNDGYIVISEITKGLTADIQGLKKDDIILSINGNDISESGFENIANKLMGKQDTTVNLIILRDNSQFNLTFKRDNVDVSEVSFKKIENIGYIQIKSFNQFMQGRIDTALNELSDCKNIIIDLRENLGGDVDATLSIAENLGINGTVTGHYYSGETEVKEAISTSDKDYKFILLVNQNTASSAEIFTALLKQFKNDVIIVGTNTYGKGIFQKEFKLSDGGSIYYTAGYYTVGNWECYQDIGITPDIIIPMDNSLIDTENDIQLEKAIEILKNN